MSSQQHSLTPLPNRSPRSTPVAIEADVDGYEDMICALTLADDDVDHLQPKKASSEKPKSPDSASSRLAPDPGPAFLAHPPSRSPSPKTDALARPPPLKSFPSSFAAGKKSAARLAAAQARQAAGKATSHRPGKPGRNPSGTGTKKTPAASWNSDSDEDEDEEEDKDEDDDEEEEEEEDERLTRHRQNNAHLAAEARAEKGSQARATMMRSTTSHTNSFYGSTNVPQLVMPHQGYERDHQGRPVSHFGTQSEMGQLPSAASRREIPSVLRDQPAERVDTAGMRPAFSQHGLLHRVMQERQEKSAKSIQEAAHWSGEPLVQVAHKPPPPQNGLLGAIASHERDRKRDGGMGAALTERARERAARQREADEMQRQSMMMMGGGMGYGLVGGYQGMVPMMYNPQMMVANPAMYEQMMLQQQQMQLQHQALMQQTYMNPHGAYGVAGAANPAGQILNPMMLGGSGMMSAHPSMYGGMSAMGSNNYLVGMTSPPILSASSGPSVDYLAGGGVGAGAGVRGSVISPTSPQSAQNHQHQQSHH